MWIQSGWVRGGGMIWEIKIDIHILPCVKWPVGTCQITQGAQLTAPNTGEMGWGVMREKSKREVK